MKTVLDFQEPKTYPAFTSVDEVYEALENAVKQRIGRIKFVNKIADFKDHFAVWNGCCELTGFTIEFRNDITIIDVTHVIWAAVNKDGNIVYFTRGAFNSDTKPFYDLKHRLEQTVWVNHGNAPRCTKAQLETVVDFVKYNQGNFYRPPIEL